MASLLPLLPVPVSGRRRPLTLNRTASSLALIVGSISLAGLPSPARAQCIENPADVFTCSGTQDSTQTLNGPNVSITTTPGFTVDTISNGGGSSFVVNGQDSVSYIDIEGSRLAGGGAYFTSGTGDLVIVSNGEIDSDLGLQGLGLETLNGGDIHVTWNGHINNSSGEGVRVTGTGDINLLLSSVYAQDGGIEINQNGPGGVSLTATGDVTSVSARGVVVTTGLASTGDISLDLRSVTASGRAVNVINQGSGGTFIRSTGMLSGILGIRVTNDVGAGELFVDVADVSGVDPAFFGNNYGVSDTFVRTRDVFSESTGLQMHNDTTAGNLTVITRNVAAGNTGISVANDGTGTTSVTAQGNVTAGGGGVSVLNGVLAQNLSVWTQGVQSGNGSGIGVTQEGNGSANVRADGTIVSQSGTGIRVRTGVQATSVTVTAAQDVRGEDWGLLIDHAGSGGVVVTAAGNIVGELEEGVWVKAGPTSGYVTLDLQGVSGDDYGVRVDNTGLGGTVIRAADAILANETGLYAENGAGSGELLIDVAGVGSAGQAVTAINNGVSGTFVRVQDVLSVNASAVRVENGATAGALTLIAGDVQGQGAGISVDNDGTGGTSVTATGTVTAFLGDGVSVGTGQQTQHLFIDVQDVFAGDNGIGVSHSGTGSVDVRAAGSVIGGWGDGVRLHAGLQSTGVKLATGAVQGGLNGVTIDNFGTGDVEFTATGTVIGELQHGLRIDNDQTAGDLRIDVQAVQGGESGIFVSHAGTGAVAISAAGPVIGQSGNGFRVSALGQSAGVMIDGASARGALNGIEVGNFGGGDTVVTLSGLAVGEQMNGVLVNHGTGAGNLLIDVAAARGQNHGISALNQSGGTTRIIVRNLAEGSMAGVAASSLFGGDIAIENQGLVRGHLAAPTSRALRAGTADSITVNNAGTLIGTAEFHGGGARLFNTGTWINGGESLFAGTNDQVANAAGGRIFAAGDALTPETTSWSGLERFDNASVLSLIDGGAGDVLHTSAATSFQTGSTLGVDFGGVASDVFRTGGTLEIQAGSQLALNRIGDMTLHHRYVVAEALQGLTGRFDFEDVYLTAFAGLRDGYTATQAYVEFAQLRALAEAGLTPNQKAAAGGADSLPAGNPLKDALLLLPSDDIARDAFDQLSGEIHATARTALVEDSRFPRDAVLDRLAEADGSGAIWVRAFEGGGVSDGNFNAARGDRDGRGMMAGIDRSVGGAVTLGGAMGVMKSDIRVDRRASRGEIESIHGMIYGGVNLGAWQLSGGLGYARTSTKTRRAIAFPGIQETLEAKYNGSVLQGFAEAGYRVPVSGGWVEPFVSVAAIRVQSDVFVEKAGGAALSGERIDEDAVISTLGLRFETSPAGSFSVRGMTGWQRNWGSVDPVGRHRFDGGEMFEVLGAAQSKDAAVTRVEARWRLSPRVGFGLGYSGVLGDGGAEHAITGVFRVAF